MKPSAFRGLHGKRKLLGEFSGVVKTYPKTTEMILMKKLGMFYLNMIGFGAVRMTVVPRAMSNVWRIQLKALFVPSVKMCLCR